MKTKSKQQRDADKDSQRKISADNFSLLMLLTEPNATQKIKNKIKELKNEN